MPCCSNIPSYIETISSGILHNVFSVEELFENHTYTQLSAEENETFNGVFFTIPWPYAASPLFLRDLSSYPFSQAFFVLTCSSTASIKKDNKARSFYTGQLILDSQENNAGLS